MSEIVLKERLTGYYYINASKADKQVFMHFQFSETESYTFNFIFPKCRVSYVFFFENPNDGNKLYLSAKAALNLQDAMDQTYFSLRKPMIAILVGDQERRSINFITNDQSDQGFSADLFDSACNPTATEDHVEAVVRQAIIEKNAGVDLTLFVVDGPLVGKWQLRFNCQARTAEFVAPDGSITLLPPQHVFIICQGPIAVSDLERILSALPNRNPDSTSQILYDSFISDLSLSPIQTLNFTVS